MVLLRALLILLFSALGDASNSSCLNPASDNYKCNSSGASQIILDNCGITDGDLEDVATCMDVFGRDTMTRVYLRYNLLTSISPNLFEGFRKLERIYLSHNNLSTLPRSAFQELTTTLQWLYVDENSLSGLSEEVFSGLGRLERLSLHENSLTTLHENIFSGLGRLQELSLTSNPDLQCVPPNNAVILEVDDINARMCGCTPAGAVICESGVFCIPGEFGYSCGTPAPTLAPTPMPTRSPSPAPSPAPTRLKNPCLDPSSDAYLCNANGTEIHLDYCGITDDDLGDVAACLDAFGRDTVTALYIRFNYLKTIAEDMFEGMGHVERLFLNNNALEDVSAESFQPLGKLQALDLNGNSLSFLWAGLFQGLGQLRHLWINMNLLSSLPSELFHGLAMLSSLDLRLNPDLQCVPANAANSVAVSKLTSRACSCSLPSTVMCDAGQTCMPGELGFTCATSAPTPAPAMPGNNTCLDPASEHYICDMPGTTINFSYCGITDRDLEDVAECIDVFGRNTTTQLDLAYNYLTTVTSGLFEGLRNVERIFLNDNALVRIPMEAFQGLEKLHALNLNRNSLVALPGSLFQQQGINSRGPVYLQEVWINMNMLTTLPAELFEGLDMLRSLDLRLNPDLQCVPTTNNDTISVQIDDLSSDICECTPTQAVMCPVGLVCTPGEFGYTCGV